MMEKQELRKKYIAFRENMAVKERERLSHLACSYLLQSESWQQAETVALYRSYKAELVTELLLQAAWQQGKKVYLPRCLEAQQGAMEFVACNGLKDLKVGAYGIFAPVGSMLLERSQPNTIFVIPAVAYAENGARLGMGGGYYDRFFARQEMQAGIRIGACFAVQMVRQLPQAQWDVLVHAVVTEKGMVWV